jgi:hypothetical protein
MSLDRYFNMKPKPQAEKMEVENPETSSSLPWV